MRTREHYQRDARGQLCPEPLRVAAECLASMNRGDELLVLADDPAAPVDFEVWCRRMGHEFLECAEDQGTWRIRLRKGPSP